MSPCPTCRGPAPSREENVAFPFCSPRCKQVDLGRWLNEEYRVPASESRDADSDPALAADPCVEGMP